MSGRDGSPTEAPNNRGMSASLALGARSRFGEPLEAGVETDGEAPQVVLCGSMSQLALMSQLAQVLRSAGVKPVVPDPDEDFKASDTNHAADIKRRASRRHMNYIRSPETAAVLVVNVDRDDECSYIGPNAFAEIAVAFADDRPIFLLQGVPSRYAEELLAWEARPLHGDLAPMLQRIAARPPDRETHRSFTKAFVSLTPRG